MKAELQNLFGEKEIVIPSSKRKNRTLLDDYDGFVDKFQPKKTTDDCYTPSKVYDCILSWVRQNCDIEGCEIIRPFYPGGDYENCEYPDNCAVIDNPPFSIISKIARFYIDRNIKFFLFAPHLTLFGADLGCTRIVCDAGIVYENGANVATSFLSNMFGDIAVMSDVSLHNALRSLSEAQKVNLPKYVYPNEVLTVSVVAWCLNKGIAMKFHKNEIHFTRSLDSQKKHGKGLFGSGFLLSEKAAAEKAAAEKAAAEKAAAEKAAAEKAAAEKANVITWELSPREIDIIKSLK